jgi:hypothetical protein
MNLVFDVGESFAIVISMYQEISLIRDGVDVVCRVDWWP